LSDVLDRLVESREVAEQLWYVAYGSNTSISYFASRFKSVHPDDPVPWTEAAWTWVPYDLYFAGSSRTWDGSAVAFLALAESPGSRSLGRAYLVDRNRFDEILDAEHLSIPLEWDYEIEELPIGTWCPLPTPAKYNAVLRVRDIEGRPAFAITTARNFEYGRPSEAYLDTCRQGLSEAELLVDVDDYLSAAVERSPAGRENLAAPPRPGAPLAWRRSLELLPSTGYPTVHLGTRESWITAEGPFPGTVEVGGRRAPVWLFPPREGQAEGASPQVFRALDMPQSEPLPARVTADYPIRLRRLPGISEDIEIADHVQVAGDNARRFGEWALLLAPSLSGPVRLSPREHVPLDAVRIPYATRELWELEGDRGDISLVPLPRVRPSGMSALRGVSRRLAELLLGAPAVPLRATESVVGDEGRAVVRVDATALDFLGVNAGDQVIVSWAGRETIARALLQTEDLRRRMRVQLAQATGRQSRLATRATSAGGEMLWHLQVWVSPAVRDVLVIPPDTVVRLRRSVFHLMLRNLFALQIPVAGLLIAALAVDVHWVVWVLVPLLAVILAFVPLRLARR
jgi:hypothetical protein